MRVHLPWPQRLKMLSSAALGIYYLHSLQPPIVHRKIKPSNLLVDENMNIKIADYGFPRINEENSSRCAAPYWTGKLLRRYDLCLIALTDLKSFDLFISRSAGGYTGQNVVHEERCILVQCGYVGSAHSQAAIPRQQLRAYPDQRTRRP